MRIAQTFYKKRFGRLGRDVVRKVGRHFGQQIEVRCWDSVFSTC